MGHYFVDTQYITPDVLKLRGEVCVLEPERLVQRQRILLSDLHKIT